MRHTAKCKPTLCIPDVSQGSAAELPEPCPLTCQGFETSSCMPPLFFCITVRFTKGKLRQREGSTKSLLCNHYHLYHLCNDCFHRDRSKPAAMSMHSAHYCFHRNMYAGLTETKLLLPRQTHQVAWFRNMKFSSNLCSAGQLWKSGSGKAAHGVLAIGAVC